MTKKISLAQQIEEVDRELALRKGVFYERQVRSGAMRQSVADFHMARLQAVKTTLEWLRDNETEVRAYVAARTAGATP